MQHRRRVLEEQPTSNEMMGLHEADGRGMKHWYLDGWICYGSIRTYVQRVPCEIVSIGGYEDTDWHTVGSAIWVQSWNSQKSAVWYCLKEPAPEYRPYHDAFLWMADFAKHLVDYLHDHEKVGLHHFKEDFSDWIRDIHDSDVTFRQWLRVYSDTDFRRILTVHASFLYNQAAQLGEAYAGHPLWAEVDPLMMDAVPRQAEQVKLFKSLNEHGPAKAHKQDSGRSTVVTPFVYECFKHLPWAKFLDVQHPKPAVLRRKRIGHSPEVDFHPVVANVVVAADRPSRQYQQTVSVGDVVAVNTDLDTDWKSNDSSWYGYVQDISELEKGTRLGLLWLYRPSDTPCQDMHYPFTKELFLSDHCNCGDKSIYAQEVVSKLNVAFYGNADTPNAHFFVRQKYNGGDGAWTTLTPSDFKCICRQAKIRPEFRAGDTWLVAKRISECEKGLEPVEIVEHCTVVATVKIRRLLRLGRDYQVDNADPNELVYTSMVEDVAVDDLFRPCHVRFYATELKNKKQIPAPYCRRGTADFYYISHCDDGALKPLLKPYPTSLKQGFEPSATSPRPVMRGLDIFCGGGTFGRGLEEGGAVEMEWAVDYFREAIHTYRANVDGPENVKLFYGSVNDYLSRAMKGEGGNLIAQLGEVEVIAAGSPCQGFSQINMTKSRNASLINISMVASVVSFVDFYRPKYALLENVLGMAKCGPKNQESNVFAQVVCALVGMGYQVRPYILDAWNFGAPQSRTRLFISIAAPGLTPLPDPPQSHSHPPGVKGRALGKTANGLPLGTRYWDLTPFEYITIKEATRDLPLNQHGKLTCIPHPDHRLSRNMSALNQGRIECVPKYPDAMNFVKAVKLGVMAKPQIEAYSWGKTIRSADTSKAWQRAIPDALIATICTACVPEDGIAGNWLHWEADRPITIMEARRAQGFPDHEVIVGSPTLQWKIVGNSVARPVALALGVSLRKAWLANDENTERVASTEANTVDEIEGLTIEELANGDAAAETTATSPPNPVQSTPWKGLTRAEIALHHDLTRASTKIKPPKPRVLTPAAPPARTLTKRLRSSLTSDDFTELPKKRRGPRQSLPTPLNSESAIVISSDEESPSQSTAQSSQTVTRDSTTSEGDTNRASTGGKRNQGGVWSASRVGELLKIGEEFARRVM